MKAIQILDNQSLVYDDFETPTIKNGEVLIEVYAAAVNRADLLQREGNYPPPPGAPNIMGLEVAGIVKETKGKKFKVGDRVCALLGGGGYAEYVASPEGNVMPIPNGLSFIEAAAIPEVYMTSYLNLFDVAKAVTGELILVTGGTSGLASAMIPMAKAAGLTVLTTARGVEKVKKVEYLGCDYVIDTTKEKISDALARYEAKGTPVNVVIDCLGGEDLGPSLLHLARGARWVQLAALAGNNSLVDFGNIFRKNIHIIGSTLRSKSNEDKERLLASLVSEFWPKFETKEISVKVCATFPIEKANEAQQMLYRGEQVGKVVLIVKE